MKTRAVILAGGEGSRLGVLTDKRAKPAVPFAGKYRIIDFTLSNCANSGIADVMILTQYRPHSLNEHIGAGRPWDLDRSLSGGVQIYAPYRDRRGTEWYKGTADALFQNLSFVERHQPDLVLVLSGDHIYKMNYGELIDHHVRHEAELTIATRSVSREDATRMGILATNADHLVTDFVEKPKDPPGTLASMGIYVFTRDVLSKELSEDAKKRDSSHDFGKDIIPRMVEAGAPVYAYPFEGYWVDVGTIESYWQTQMELLDQPPPLDLNDRSWIIHTRSEERPPVMIQEGAIVRDSLITDGCVVQAGALVERSVLSPGVTVGVNAIVRESVVLTDTSIGAGARVQRAIVDKSVCIGKGAKVGGRLRHGEGKPEGLGLTTVGKNAQIAEKTEIPVGATIESDEEAAPPAKDHRVPSGRS